MRLVRYIDGRSRELRLFNLVNTSREEAKSRLSSVVTWKVFSVILFFENVKIAAFSLTDISASVWMIEKLVFR